MDNPSLQRVMRHIRQLAGRRAFGLTPEAEASDQELLTRFTNEHDEAAFGTLVRRHGPMVRGVCQRLLDQDADRDDAFQATFLVLLHKARSIRKRHSVGSWLYGVAYRIALKARASAARRRSLNPRPSPQPSPSGREGGCSWQGEIVSAANPNSDPSREAAWRELCALLDQELLRLSDRYRSPLVLCYLSGQTQEEAAGHLGWSLRTLKRRLEQAKDIMRLRLSRRGLTLSSTLLIAVLSHQEAAAAVPLALGLATIKQASLVVAGKSTTATISANALALTQAAIRSLALGKLKIVMACVVFAGLAAAGAGLAFQQLATRKLAQANVENLSPQDIPPAAPPKLKDKKPARTDSYGDPLPEGVLMRLGTVCFQQDGNIFALAYSPDGRLLVSAGGESSGFRGPGWSPKSYGLNLIWDPLTGKELRRLEGYEKEIRSIAFSTDGKVLASASDDKIVLWDIVTGKELPRINRPAGLTMSLAFSKDNKLLFTTLQGPENAISAWDTTSGQLARKFTAPEKGYANCVAVSPDGRILAAGWDSQSTPLIFLWEVESGRLLHQLKFRPAQINAVWSLSFSPDGKMLASGSEDEIIRLWDVASGQEIRQIATKAGYMVSFSSDGKMLASTGSGGGGLWDPATGRQIRSLQDKLRRPNLIAYEGQPYDRAAFSPDGKTLAWSTNNAIRLLDTSTGEDRLPSNRHAGPVRSVAISPDGKTIASAGDRLRLWDAGTGKERVVLGKVEQVCCVSFSPDGKSLVGGSGYQTLHLWDVSSGKEIREFTGDPGILDFVAFLPDGKSVASMSRHTVHPISKNRIQWKTETQVRVWDIESGKQIRSLGNVQLSCAALARDGKVLATGGTDWKVRFWNTNTGKESRQFLSNLTLLPVLAFSSDGRRIAVPFRDHDSYGMALFERITGEEILRFEGLQGWVGSLATSPRQPLLASGEMDGSIRLWELDSGKELRQLSGHQGGVLSLAFSPNGDQLISGSRDTTVMIWDVRNVLPAPSAESLKPQELHDLGAQLVEDAPQAMKAVARLARAGDQAIPFLRNEIFSPTLPQAQKITGLITDLDNDSVVVREKATQELTKLGKYAEPILRRTLENKPSNEVQSRIELLLRRLGDSKLAPEVVRILRILDVLERIGTPEAQRLVESIAEKVQEPRLVSEAKDSLDRLATRSKPKP